MLDGAIHVREMLFVPAVATRFLGALGTLIEGVVASVKICSEGALSSKNIQITAKTSNRLGFDLKAI